MIPEGEAGEDFFFEVGEDLIERFGFFGRGGGKGTSDVAGADGGEHGVIAGVFEIVSDPIGVLVGGAEEIFFDRCRRNGRRFGRHILILHGGAIGEEGGQPGFEP